MSIIRALAGEPRGGRRRGRRMSLAETLITEHMDYDDAPEEDDETPNDDNSTFTQSDSEQLEKLAQLKDKGIITEEEFNKKKKLILGI